MTKGIVAGLIGRMSVHQSKYRADAGTLEEKGRALAVAPPGRAVVGPDRQTSRGCLVRLQGWTQRAAAHQK